MKISIHFKRLCYLPFHQDLHTEVYVSESCNFLHNLHLIHLYHLLPDFGQIIVRMSDLFLDETDDFGDENYLRSPENLLQTIG